MSRNFTGSIYGYISHSPYMGQKKSSNHKIAAEIYRCQCVENVVGDLCNRCEEGSFLSDEGCAPCACEHGSSADVCDLNGRCTCDLSSRPDAEFDDKCVR